MPKGVSRPLYKVVCGKNRWQFSSRLRLGRLRSGLALAVLGASLAACTEIAGPLTSGSTPARDFLDITGSLAGNRSGFSLQYLDESDQARALVALGQALDPMNGGQASLWTSSTGQVRGTFTARGMAFVHEERLCREFVAALEDKRGVKETDRQQWPGVACREGLGAWAVVDGQRLSKNN